MFKTIDQKLADIGFIQVSEDEHGASYIRDNSSWKHKVVLLHKINNAGILQSYDPDLIDKWCRGNIGVGLTYHELKLFMKKMKQLKLDTF